MTRAEIESRLRIVVEELGLAERWLVVAKDGAAEGWRARIALLEAEQRVLRDCLAGSTEAESPPG